jgi:hypothetical protein
VSYFDVGRYLNTAHCSSLEMGRDEWRGEEEGWRRGTVDLEMEMERMCN